MIAATEGDNDGLLSVTSAKWGTFEGTIHTDHLGEIGQLLGFPAAGFNHYTFYSSIAQLLENDGF